MGIDYSYNLVIKKNMKEEVYNFIRNNGIINNGSCFVNVSLDSQILKFLECGKGKKIALKTDTDKDFILYNNTVNVGNIDIVEKKIDKDKVLISFIGVTDEMSNLISESISLRKFFLNLSENVSSIITFIDLEWEGYKIIYYNGDNINISLEVGEEEDICSSKFLEIISEFSNNIKKAFY